MQLHQMESILTREDVHLERPVARTKFNISVEKKIERLWLVSKQQGWSFNHFTAIILEVLTILHHRNQLQENGTTSRKLSRTRRALS